MNKMPNKARCPWILELYRSYRDSIFRKNEYMHIYRENGNNGNLEDVNEEQQNEECTIFCYFMITCLYETIHFHVPHSNIL